MILRAILLVILATTAVRCQHGLTPGGSHDALSVGRQGSSSSRSTLVNDIRGALNSALDTGRLGSLGGSSSSTQNGVQQEPLPGLGSTDQLRSSPGGFPQTVVEAQQGQGSLSGGTTDQFGGFDTSNQDFGFGGRSENIPPRSQDSTGAGSFMTSGGRSGTPIGTLPSGSDTSSGSSGFMFGTSGTTGTLLGSGTGAQTQTGQGQSFGFGAPPTGFGSQMGPGFNFGPSGTTGTLLGLGTGGQTGQGQSFGFGVPPTGFGSQMGPGSTFGSSGTTGTLSGLGNGGQTGQGQSFGFGAPPTGFGSQMGPGSTFGASGTTGTLSGLGTGGQTGQGQSFGFGALPTGFGSQMGPGSTFGASGTTGTLSEPGNGGQTGQGQSFGFGSPPTGFGSQMGPAFPFSPPMDSGPQMSASGFGMPPTGGAGLGAMTGMTGTFGIRPPSGAGVNVGNMTPPGNGMFMPQGPGSFMMQPPGQGMGAFTSRMNPAGPMFGPGSTGGVTFGAEGNAGSDGMQGFPRGMSFPGMPPPTGMTFAGVPGSSGSTTGGGSVSSRLFSPVPGMGPTGGFDQSLGTPGVSGFFTAPGFPPGMNGGQQPGTGSFGIPTGTGSGSSTEWQNGAFFPGSFGLSPTGTGGSGASTGGGGGGGGGGGRGTDASSGTFPGMAFVPGTGGPILPPGFFVPGGGQVSGGGGSSGRDSFFPESTRTGSGGTGLSGGPFGPFGDFSSSQGFDPRMMPGGGPGQFMPFGAGPIFARRGRMPMDFFIRRR